MVLNARGRIVSVNAALGALLDPHARPLGRRPLEVLMSLELQHACERILGLRRSRRCCADQLTIVSGERTFEVSLVRLEDPDQKPGAVWFFPRPEPPQAARKVRQDFVANVPTNCAPPSPPSRDIPNPAAEPEPTPRCWPRFWKSSLRTPITWRRKWSMISCNGQNGAPQEVSSRPPSTPPRRSTPPGRPACPWPGKSRTAGKPPAPGSARGLGRSSPAHPGCFAISGKRHPAQSRRAGHHRGLPPRESRHHRRDHNTDPVFPRHHQRRILSVSIAWRRSHR